jgi:hypothetical protein
MQTKADDHYEGAIAWFSRRMGRYRMPIAVEVWVRRRPTGPFSRRERDAIVRTTCQVEGPLARTNHRLHARQRCVLIRNSPTAAAGWKGLPRDLATG